MVVTILGSIVIFVMVAILILSHKNKVPDKSDTFVAVLSCIIYMSIIAVSLFKGYSLPNHGGIEKEDVKTYSQAVAWNEEEHRFNSYFFRFTLREENLIDLSEFEENGNALQ